MNPLAEINKGKKLCCFRWCTPLILPTILATLPTILYNYCNLLTHASGWVSIQPIHIYSRLNMGISVSFYCVMQIKNGQHIQIMCTNEL